MEERRNAIKHILKSTRDALATLEGFAGKKAIQKIREGFPNACWIEYPILVKRYEIERLFKELEENDV